MLIYLDDPSTWPGGVEEYVNDHPDEPTWSSIEIHRAWVERRVEGGRIVGWHCTRLTRTETVDVLDNGLRILTSHLVMDRVERAADEGLIDSDLADTIRQNNWAYLDNRQGRIAFVGARSPLRRRHHGIMHFLREWGGEAIAFPLEKTSHQPALRKIGTPTVVETAVDFAEVDHIWPNVWTVMWEAVHTPATVDGEIVTSAAVSPGGILGVIQPGSSAWHALFDDWTVD